MKLIVILATQVLAYSYRSHFNILVLGEELLLSIISHPEIILIILYKTFG